MTKMLTFTGWGQPADALRPLVGNDAEFFDYHRYPGFAALAEALRDKPLEADVVFGWSLGGQVAMRLIDAGLLKTKLLVLLATSYQFVANDNVPDATPKDMFETYRTGYANFPDMTMQTFQTLLLRGDSKGAYQKQVLDTQKNDADGYWLEWLDELGDFSCLQIDGARQPKTLIIQGKNDVVTPATHAQRLMDFIPHAACLQLKDCGHMPHLHDPKRIRQWIEDLVPAMAYVR